jgi:hypothetical protein
MSLIKKSLFFLWLVLLPIQDSFLQATPLHSLGGSPASLPLLILAAISLLEWLIGREWQVHTALLGCMGYAVLITTFNLLFTGPTSHGTNLVVKALNTAVLLGVFLYPVFFFDYGDRRLVRFGVILAFAVCVIGVLLGDLNFLGLRGLVQNNIMHYTHTTDLRFRGFAWEASAFSVQIITMGLLAIELWPGRFGKAVLGTVLLSILSVSSSKGGFATIALTCVIVALLCFRFSFRGLGLALILAIPIPFYAIGLLQQVMTRGIISDTTTVATRGSMAVWAAITVLHNPLGVGFSGFYPAVSRYLPSAIDIFGQSFWLPLNYYEVRSYLTSIENISTKSFVLNQTVYFGLPFLVAFFIFQWRLISALKRQRRIILLGAVVFTLLAITIYIDAITAYNTSLLFGFALHEVRNGRSKEILTPPQDANLPMGAG